MRTGTSPGLRERKNRRTREAIVRAAAELTLEDGYAHATIPRIAERADVSPRTVSTWFPAKDDILLSDGQEQFTAAAAHILGGDGPLTDRLGRWFAEEGERGPRDPELTRLRTQALAQDPTLRAHDSRAYEVVGTAVAAAVADELGEAADGLGPQMVAGATIAMLKVLRAASFTQDTDAMGPLGEEALRRLAALVEALSAGR